MANDRRLSFLLLCCMLVVGSAVPARANVAVEGGAFAVRGAVSGGAALSLGLVSAPLAPISLELTGATPFNGAGYGVTLDGRLDLAGTTIGAGVGFGNLAAPQTTGVLYDVILGHSLTGHLAVEGRMYLGAGRPSSLFAGLRLSLKRPRLGSGGERYEECQADADDGKRDREDLRGV